MLPASGLDTWEQAVAARDQAFAKGGDSAKFWVDTKRPALPSDCPQVHAHKTLVHLCIHLRM
jgi:hypothetical protein